MRTTKARKKNGTDAIALAEEAFRLLRSIPAGALLTYYMGTLPFILGILYYWADMTTSPFAAERLVPGTALLSVLFLWMKYWQSAFSRKLIACLLGTVPVQLTFSQALRAAVRQMFIHATGLFILPIACLFTLPAAWVYAFYQNATILEAGEGLTLTAYCGRCWRLALKWPGQNHLLLSALFFLGFFVFVNVAVAIFLLPHMLNKFLGIETLFTLSGIAVLNTTFLAVVAGLTYLCMDPVIKAVYALRCFYGRAIHTGEDMLAAMKKLSQTAILLVLASGGILYAGDTLAAGDTDRDIPYNAPAIASPDPERVRDLDETISDVLTRREFTWRLPREKEEKKIERSDSWISKMLEWLSDSIGAMFKKIGEWIEAFFDWLDGLMPDDSPEKITPEKKWRLPVRPIFYFLCVLAALALTYLIYRALKKRRKREKKAPVKAIRVEPDLSDENIKADDLPTDRWLALAKEKLAKESFRHAIRALYLAVLAFLAEKDRLKIAKYKSNRDYRDELSRRFRDETELIGIFTKAVFEYERVWYGTQPADRADVDRFFERHGRLLVILG